MVSNFIYDKESQSWKPYKEPYKTIECPTEKDYQYLVDAIEHYKKRGQWEQTAESIWRCSACGEEWYFEAGNPIESGADYCPQCGAKMEVQNETD